MGPGVNPFGDEALAELRAWVRTVARLRGSAMRVAAIDCGTNSIRLLIADVTDAGLVDVARVMRVVRLGEGVDVTGRLAPGAIERTWSAVEDYAAQIRQAGAERVRMVATSASRDAENADEFTAGVVQRLGTPPEVISGDEEARLSFAGAVSVLEVPGRVAVVDIGEDPPSSSSGTTRWRPPSARTSAVSE